MSGDPQPVPMGFAPKRENDFPQYVSRYHENCEGSFYCA